MSRLGDRSTRADARRNAQRILDAAAELTAVDPAASLEQVAARAGVSRATLYHHFSGRSALMDALTERSVTEVRAAFEMARPDEGPPAEAMERLLLGAWRVVEHYRGLVIVNQRLERFELRARLEPALVLMRRLIARGQAAGDFDPDLPADWLLSVLTDLIHGASRQVIAASMTPEQAERTLLRSAAGVLTAHRHIRRRELGS